MPVDTIYNIHYLSTFYRKQSCEILSGCFACLGAKEHFSARNLEVIVLHLYTFVTLNPRCLLGKLQSRPFKFLKQSLLKHRTCI